MVSFGSSLAPHRRAPHKRLAVGICVEKAGMVQKLTKRPAGKKIFWFSFLSTANTPILQNLGKLMDDWFVLFSKAVFF